MCGINGIFAYAPAAAAVDRTELLRVRDSMIARGPDGAGVWIGGDGRVGLAHRRLAILDLSEAGAQPMHSTDGRLVVSFNGEIYNYPELRSELERDGIAFRSHSDTEVLLHLYRRHGPAMVGRLRGMFAFALWDAQARSLLLARDPHGIKPLYYADDGRTVRFASQVSALLAGQGMDTRPEPAGAVGFLLWGSVPEPFTLYRGIRLLPAGSTLMVTEAAGASAAVRYWSLSAALKRSVQAAEGVPVGGEPAFMRERLLDSVRAHLLADVPVGAFLSAGLDSSTLVGLAREASPARLRTLTLSFDDLQGTQHDECPAASLIARHLDVDHTCIVLSAGEQEDELDRFFAAMDQPTIDGINTWFVSRAARQAGLKVALSGLGGDELLGGYATFAELPRLRARAQGSLWRHAPSLYRDVHRLLGARLGWPPNAAGIPGCGTDPEGAYHLLKGVFMPWELDGVLDADALREGLHALAEKDAAHIETLAGLNDFGQVASLESVRYMRNQLLRDTDWVSMSHSLEIRVPLVDHVLSEALLGLAASGRLGAGKSMLPRTLARGLPDEILNRPKSGFVVPTWRWLRHHPGLDAWRSVPALKHPRMSDGRRWAYTLLSRHPAGKALIRN
ncbi:asparagine synthase (glutamine-hydrolyzing) [Thauera sp.]